MTPKENAQHILVVEDDSNTAEMLTAYFASLGYQVTHAAWGQDAISLATQLTPDLIVLDIHLPDIDGYEVCSRLRAHHRTMHIPIIFLAARNERRDQLTGLELGAVDYITKPFDVHELRYRVRNVLQQTTSSAAVHPLTGLPTFERIQEQLQRLHLHADIVLAGVRIHGLLAFGDAFGFVSHDDILRAVAMMLRNTVMENPVDDGFVGHLHTYDFVVTVPETQRNAFVKRVEQRLQEAIAFFYPYQDRESGHLPNGMPIPKINFEMRFIQPSQLPPGYDVELLRQLLFDAPRS